MPALTVILQYSPAHEPFARSLGTSLEREPGLAVRMGGDGSETRADSVRLLIVGPAEEETSPEADPDIEWDAAVLYGGDIPAFVEGRRYFDLRQGQDEALAGLRSWLTRLRRPPMRRPLWAICALVLLTILSVRIRLLSAPLERDEGEHGYMAQTMLAGNPPWKLAYNMKLPGTDAMYAVSMALFGQTADAIRLGLLLVNLATIFLVALLGKRLFGTNGGLAAGACYGLLSAGQGVYGTIAHSTHFVAFFAAAAILLLLDAGVRPGKLFVSGLVFGLTFLMKQPGLAFARFAVLYLAWRLWKSRSRPRAACQAMTALASGIALPYALLCLALWRFGVFGRFWYWTVTLVGAYAGQRQLSDHFEYLRQALPLVVGPNLGLWLLAGLGLGVACWHRTTRPAGLAAGALLAVSLAAVSAGGVYNPHYFIMMLPAVALAAGAWVASAERIPAKGGASAALARGLPCLCFAAACLWSVAAQRSYLFTMTPYEFCRNTYGRRNPFPEGEKVGEYIRSHSAPGASVAVLGSEAEIYFYSRRRAATGYLFTYGLMETHGYAAAEQGEAIGEIEASRPEYIVYVRIQSTWLIRPTSARAIFYWAADYLSRYYEREGVVDIPDFTPAKYVWGPGAVSYLPESPVFIEVFRRRR